MVDVAPSSFRVVFNEHTSMRFGLRLSRVHVAVDGNEVRFAMGLPQQLVVRAKSAWISTRFECALFELEPKPRAATRARYPYIFVGGSTYRMYPFEALHPITGMSYPPSVPRLRFALCTDDFVVYRMNYGASHTFLPLRNPTHRHAGYALTPGMSLEEIHRAITAYGKLVHARSGMLTRRNMNVRVEVA